MIKGDQTGWPWVEFWGDWLHCIDVPQCSLSFPFGNVGGVDHVDRFHLGRKFLLSPRVWTPGPLVLVFSVYFTGLFKYSAVSIGVVGWFVRGAMNLARALQYAV